MKNLYRLEDVSKIYCGTSSKTYALDHVDLEINAGEFVIILGPSGSGKSTLLHILAGLDYITSGSVFFGDLRIDNLSSKDLNNYRRDNLGFVFQSYNLVPNLTVWGNILLSQQIVRRPLNGKNILKVVGLGNFFSKYPYQLSGGQMQRVAIARALVKNPSVLFCDEPTGSMDEKTGKVVLNLLQAINHEYGMTVIMVTHNPGIALMANTVIKMDSGRIRSVTKTNNVTSAFDLRWS
ncbi:MAG: ABC transporter ATP-binding protein [Bacilli bacterium]